MFGEVACILLLFAATAISTHTVTINFELQPLWYQTKFYDIVDGKNIPTEIVPLTLHFVHTNEYKWTNAVTKIKNFPTVKKIFMDKYNQQILPSLVNVPELKEVSFSGNLFVKVGANWIANTMTEVVILSRNRIEIIDDGSFGENVKELFLTCNNLTAMSPRWFKNAGALESLNMGGNRIQAVPENMFKDFTNLLKIQLRNNQLLTIGDGALNGLKNLIILHIAYNNLTELKPTILTSPIKIDYMDVQYNKLSFLHEDLMANLKVKTFKFWGNPWQCPCRDKIYEWINRNSGNKTKLETLPREDDPSCVFAQSFQYSCITVVDEELIVEYFNNFESSPIKFC